MDEEKCIVNDGYPWYAVRLFSNKQEEVADFFEKKSLQCFIPKQYHDTEGRDGKLHHELKPVVRNLLFIKKTINDLQMRQLVTECDYKLSVLRKSNESQDFYEIPASQMYEFRLMCNPEITMRQFVSAEEAKMKPGTEVLVKFGPLKGLTGRLVRSSKKYFLLKEIPGIAVMLKVTRWCCVPIEKA